MSEIRVNKVVNSTGDNDSGLDMTNNDEVLIKTANTTAITVNASQNVGIGTTPNNLLEVRGTSSGQQVLHLSNSVGASQGGATNDIRVTCGGNTYWGNLNINANQMTFSPQGTECMRIHSNGVLSASNGIALGVGTANTASNVLDDYEEGALSLGITTGTASFAYARYTKIGNSVTIRFQISNISDRSTASPIYITGLPFTASSANQATQGIMGRYFNGGGDAIVAYISANQTRVEFFQTQNGANYVQVLHSNLNNANAVAYVTITYESV